MNYEKMIKRFVKILDEAHDLAVQNRDVEALVAISDRWYALIEHIDEPDKNTIPLGFIQEKEHDDRKAGNKRKS